MHAGILFIFSVLEQRLIEESLFNNIPQPHAPPPQASSSTIPINRISIGSRMNASAFRDLWARLMF